MISEEVTTLSFDESVKTMRFVNYLYNVDQFWVLTEEALFIFKNIYVSYSLCDNIAYKLFHVVIAGSFTFLT